MPEETLARLLARASEFLFRIFRVFTADILFFTTIAISFTVLSVANYPTLIIVNQPHFLKPELFIDD